MKNGVSLIFFCGLGACMAPGPEPVPADGFVLVQAIKSERLGGTGPSEAMQGTARDLSESLPLFVSEEPRDELGCKIVSSGNGDPFPGSTFDAGDLVVQGASIFGQDITLHSSLNTGILDYSPDVPLGASLFAAGDKLRILGEGAGVIEPVEGEVTFPLDMVLVDPPQEIIRGQAIAFFWDSPPTEQDELVSVLVSTSVAADFAIGVSCVAPAAQGFLVLPSELTALLPKDPVEQNAASVQASRINGGVIDFEDFAARIQAGQQTYFEAINTVSYIAPLQ